jgi:DNA invertase Pin-like site-specific DNA recombinase
MEVKRFYGRVSGEQQNLDRQIDIAERLGIIQENTYWEKMTGTVARRPALDKMLSDLEEEKKIRGKEVKQRVYIESLSRMGRSTMDLLALLEKFQEMGVTIVSEKEQIDTSTASGKLMTTLLAALAEFEVSILRERTQQGLEAARSRGKFGGRPKKDKSTVKVALSLYDSKEYSIKEICARCNISQGTLYKYIRARKVEKEA